VVLAGGYGTRLFGLKGGSKALFILNGRPLIDYSLASIRHAGVTEIAIVVRETDNELRSTYPHCVQIQETGVGTLPAVLAAATYAANKGADAIISSCDLVCPLPAVSALVEGASEHPDWLATFGVTPIANDQSPIWVHSDSSGRITNYGKGVDPSKQAFASIRFATLGFLELMRSTSKQLSGDVDTDTKLMRHLIVNERVTAGAVDIGPALDVDDEVDAKIAENISQSFRGV
jgi:NDP-sugar pyrophosphorylase family protein